MKATLKYSILNINNNREKWKINKNRVCLLATSYYYMTSISTNNHYYIVSKVWKQL